MSKLQSFSNMVFVNILDSICDLKNTISGYDVIPSTIDWFTTLPREVQNLSNGCAKQAVYRR